MGNRGWDHDGLTKSGPRSILVIIPAYNEERSISAVIDEIRWNLLDADVLVVDDGSDDATAEIARQKGACVVHLPFNCGIGAAMQTGYLFAQERGYEVAVQVDADGQHDPSQCPRILKPILDGDADVVIGSRFLEGSGYRSTAARRAGIIWLSILISSMARARFSDPTSGFRAASRAAFSYFASDYPTDYPEPEVIVPLCRRGFRVIEAPVTMRNRKTGRSSITALRSIYYMIKVTLAVSVGLLRASGRRRVKKWTELKSSQLQAP